MRRDGKVVMRRDGCHDEERLSWEVRITMRRERLWWRRKKKRTRNREIWRKGTRKKNRKKTIIKLIRTSYLLSSTHFSEHKPHINTRVCVTRRKGLWLRKYTVRENPSQYTFIYTCWCILTIASKIERNMLLPLALYLLSLSLPLDVCSLQNLF